MEEKLERKIGLISLIGLGVGATVGSGIFSTISQVAGAAQSSLFLVLAFLIGALIQIPGSFSYAELTSAYPEDGGHYVYFREAGCKSLTFICGWVTFLAIDAPAVSVMSLAAINYLSFILPINIVLIKIIVCFIVITFAFMHIKSVKVGSFVQTFITIIKIIPFFLIIAAAIFFTNPDLFLSNQNAAGSTMELFSINGISALVSAIALSMFSFDGMFAGCYVSGEIKNPKKTLPLGLVLTALVIMCLYVMLSASATGFMSIQDLSASSAPIADMVSHIPSIGSYASIIVAVLAFIVIIGAISSCLLYMPRFEYAMAKDGLFFSFFAKVHKKYKTPYTAIIIFTIYVLVLTLTWNISALLNSLTLVIVLKNAATYFLVFILRKKDNYKPTYKSPGNFSMPIIAFLANATLFVFTLLNSTFVDLVFNIVIITIGYIAYLIYNCIGKKSK